MPWTSFEGLPLISMCEKRSQTELGPARTVHGPTSSTLKNACHLIIASNKRETEAFSNSVWDW